MSAPRLNTVRAGSSTPGPAPFPGRVVLIFVDGLGVGSGGPEDPTAGYGGDLLHFARSPGAKRAIDAALGVPGTPQSATGQTSLFTGRNAQAALGHHATGFPGPVVRELLREHSLLRSLRARGRDGVFLNAFRPLFWELTPEQQWRLSASTVANLAADLPFFALDDVRAGRAVYQDITNADLRERGFDVPLWQPARAGEVLARASAARDFTLFEYFQTDKAGHSQDPDRCRRVLRELDAFVRAHLAAAAPDTLTLLTSDHGNIEDLSLRSHTRNPVPLLAWGPGSEAATAAIAAIDQVAPFILDLLPARA